MRKKLKDILSNEKLINDFIDYYSIEFDVKPKIVLTMIEHNFIKPNVIFTYAVNKKYNDIIDSVPKKEAAILEIAHRYKLGRTYIFRLLKYGESYFRKIKYKKVN